MTIKEVEKPFDDTTATEPNVELSSGIPSPNPPNDPSPPSCPPIQRGNNDDNHEKCCRICLQDDHPQDMIAPCQCKGSSKWVHRQCLDQWRIHETDRAFSKCTECLFTYHLQPVPSAVAVLPSLRRRVKYTLLVTRDVCLATLYLQLAIAFFGWIGSAIDSNRDLPRLLNSDMPIAVYYMLGFFIVLVISGICGMVLFCSNNCSIRESLAPFPEGNSRGTVEQQPSYQDRSAHYQQSRQTYQNRNDCCTNCYWACSCCGSSPSPPYYYSNPDGCCDLCLCCGQGGPSSSGAAVSAASSGGPICDGEGAVILLFILLAISIFLAIIGFFIGMVLCVVIFQRTLQRHIYIVHKRQLAGEFQVMDLAEYDADSYGSTTDLEQPQASSTNPRPTAPTLAEHDVRYLRDIGLMD